MRIARPATVTPTKSGGLSPPWCATAIATASANTAVGSVPSNCGSAFASALPIRDGGLTPAAPAACAFVHRKSRNSVGWRTSREQEWGRKPPVVRETAIRKTIRFPFNAGRHNSGCGNVIATAFADTPATVCRTIAEAPLQVRQPDARRAHARRSCCVCVCAS